MSKFTDEFLKRKRKLAVVGLGYVGLPVVLEFGRRMPVIAYDYNNDLVAKLQAGIDPGGEWKEEDFHDRDILFTDDAERLSAASFYIVAVPTPIDNNNNPDLSFLVAATRTIAGCLNPGDYVVFESTVFPGATEDICVPEMEKISGMKVGTDFKVGYSPERINPGDKTHLLPNVTKVVSGCDREALDRIAEFYKIVVEAEVFKAKSIKVAEAAKIIENTQRDVNIALMNELSIIFGRLGINTYDVLEAAGTKWNFLPFRPGLVGGHCIGVDPYYLAHKAREVKYHPQVINSGRAVNDSMGVYVAKQTVKKLIESGKSVPSSRVLIKGITFKENVSDIRNSRVGDIIVELKSYGITVEVEDPYASPENVLREYNEHLVEKEKGTYDAVIVAVAHRDYADLDEDYFRSLLTGKGALIDVKGIYHNKISGINYWSL